MKQKWRWRTASLGVCLVAIMFAAGNARSAEFLSWEELPELPHSLGVAGPFAGVHNDALIVAGGANFPRPVWETDKQWVTDVHVLVRQKSSEPKWVSAQTLSRRVAYGASVSTPDGVVCMGGNDGRQTFADVQLLQWNQQQNRLEVTSYPPLPEPCAFGSATLLGEKIYLAGGQSSQELSSAMTNFWSLDLRHKGDLDRFQWQRLTAWPGDSRALNLTVHQHNGYDDCVYVISGRRQSDDGEFEFLKDVWEYAPVRQTWRRRADTPRPVMAAPGIGIGQSHILVLGGDDGRLFTRADELKDDHPGFPRDALLYHTITDRWCTAGVMPQNAVTTTAIKWGDAIVVPSGEIRPRVRTPKILEAHLGRPNRQFGALNYAVLFTYLFAMVGVGFYFTNKNRNTDDFFRGGKHLPWWAAGCSIFATMLSSLTYTGVPSKAFAQDWVYMVGNVMIPVVAVVAVYVALPFYRRIDATSAYEYLELRFNRTVRLFGSLSFTLFHIFRMSVVMSLTALALAVATPLTPIQSVLLMGVLSITYCTLGGIEAVVWTDTVQTFVLLGGACFALCLLVAEVDGGISTLWATGIADGKFRMANFHTDVTNARIAIWVVVVGGIAQNISSYTADQAVVQRYMTTSTEKLAARSIWTNAWLSIPASLLFFGIGTALYVFYQTHPEKLDPMATTDQIFPLFIATEMPVGIAGLLVAGIFAAAQSTVSTSMNSTATSIVTDLMRPFDLCRSERGYFVAARILTVLMGVIGTGFAIIFIDPQIKSLFDAFLKVIGLFMGVLGGLFVLGVLTRRANGPGAVVGALVGAAVMLWLWSSTRVNGYLYTASGIGACVVAGYFASLVIPASQQDLRNVTIYTLETKDR